MGNSKRTQAAKKQRPTLGKRLRDLRKAKGWSQADLADRIGAHLTHVSRVETGKYNPGLDFVVNAAEALDVTVDQLLSEESGTVQDVRIEDKGLAERLRLLDELDEEERGALIKVMDAMLTKHRMLQVLQQQEVAP